MNGTIFRIFMTDDYSLFLVRSFDITGLTRVVSNLLGIRRIACKAYFTFKFAVSPKRGTPKTRTLQIKIIRKCSATKKPNNPKKEENRIQMNLAILTAPIREWFTSVKVAIEDPAIITSIAALVSPARIAASPIMRAPKTLRVPPAAEGIRNPASLKNSNRISIRIASKAVGKGIPRLDSTTVASKIKGIWS